MRGEHCVAAASVLSGIALILLVFANIGQISAGALTSNIYMAQVNMQAYGNALQSATKTSAGGLYDTKNDKLGTSKGIRQTYRYGLYTGCGYQKSGTGICNSSTIGYPMTPLANVLADTPASFKKQTYDIIPKSTFKDNTYNYNISKGGSILIFLGSCFCVLALIAGVIKHRFAFFVAAVCAGLSAFLLMVGAAMWSALIAKDAWLKIVKVEGGASLGIQVTAGATLYLTWVSFVLMTLAVVPYVVSCCTYRK